MWCANHDDQKPDWWPMRTWDQACINSRVEVRVRCVESALGLGGHVVIGVVRLTSFPRSTVTWNRFSRILISIRGPPRV